MAQELEWWYRKMRENGEVEEKDYKMGHFFMDLLCVALTIGHVLLKVGQVAFMISWRLAAIFFVPLFWVIYGCYKDDKGGNSL